MLSNPHERNRNQGDQHTGIVHSKLKNKPIFNLQVKHNKHIKVLEKLVSEHLEKL